MRTQSVGGEFPFKPMDLDSKKVTELAQVVRQFSSGSVPGVRELLEASLFVNTWMGIFDDDQLELSVRNALKSAHSNGAISRTTRPAPPDGNPRNFYFLSPDNVRRLGLR